MIPGLAPVALKGAPAFLPGVSHLRRRRWLPQHRHRREADREHLLQALLGGGEAVVGVADKDIRAHAVRGARETGFEQTACRRAQRLELVAWIVSEEHRRP